MSVKSSKGFVLALVLVLSTVALAVGAQPAKADATFASSSVTCSSFSARGTVTTTYVAVRIWNLTAGQSEGGPALIDSYFNVGAPTAYFAAAGGAFSFSVHFPEQHPGDVIRARIYATDSPVFGGWDGGAFPQVDVSCGGSFEGPGIPAGFVMMTVVRPAVVYDSPGGSVVPNVKTLEPGSTWYMSPVTVKDSHGTLWREVFLAGWNNAFIPANSAQ